MTRFQLKIYICEMVWVIRMLFSTLDRIPSLLLQCVLMGTKANINCTSIFISLINTIHFHVTYNSFILNSFTSNTSNWNYYSCRTTGGKIIGPYRFLRKTKTKKTFFCERKIRRHTKQPTNANCPFQLINLYCKQMLNVLVIVIQ